MNNDFRKPYSLLGRRLLAALLDYGIVIIAMVLLYFSVGKMVVLPAIGYEQSQSERKYLLETPGVLQKDGDKYVLYSFRDYDANTDEYGYAKYEPIVWRYYTYVVPGYGSYEFVPSAWGKDLFFDESRRGDASYVGKWVYENLYGETYYEPAKDGQGNVDYTLRPVLKESAKQVDGSGRLLLAHELRSYYLSVDGQSGLYADAVKHLYSQSKLISVENDLLFKQWVSVFPSIILAPIAFFFIVPMMVPGGKTVGRYFLGVGVAKEDGSPVSRPWILLRSLLPTFVWFLLFIRPHYLGIALLLVAGAILDAPNFLLPQKKGIPDLLARTTLIDSPRIVEEEPSAE